MAKLKRPRAGAGARVRGHSAPPGSHPGSPVRVDELFAAAVQREQAGRFGEAEFLYRQVLALRPDLAEAHVNLGNVLAGQGKLDDASAAFRQGIALRPDIVHAHFNFGNLLRTQGKLDEAAAAYRRAIAVWPGFAAAHFNLAHLLKDQGKLDEAVALYRRAIIISPRSAEAYNNLGSVLKDQGKLDEAAVAYRRAFAVDPGCAEAHNNLGGVLEEQGLLGEAAASYRRAIDLKPDLAMAHNSLARLRPMNDRSCEAEAEFALLSRQVEDLDQFEPKQRSLLLFAMGKALEDRGDFDRAFACMAEANAIHRSGLTFDVGAVERRMDSIATVFSRALLERLKGEGLGGERPIFIVGMPRSGSTLVEQIISAHPHVHAAGEIANLSDLIVRARGRDGSPYPLWAETADADDLRTMGQAYLDSLPSGAPRQTRITDKWLANFMHLGLIHLCLPGARIIHCQRDPRDVCLSCFATPFKQAQEFAYDPTELGRYSRAYDRLMAHWRAALPPGRMLEAPYESIVDDVEGWARRLIAHCGLDWDDACLRFYENTREVRTASAAQVRRPIYTSSVGRWRAFARHLGPLLDALGEPWGE